ncbi:MarR family winged helix-turn-helix transcriptional regulator [Clostridium botulinum]|uniref:MarR family winged helix-turn-helix transcriptional regulator n=1 Tax=Clostridium botulinum TaxID=1491 RepID=UPI000774E000|nr:MarR family transcriptional regulator [Clostridium botulinum]NFE96053.1 MarR family transcriptional regulator [Clostridium botulinum]NFL39493.1 MarR family transcriptional regulator [Clostridium botulinum]NFL66253.1 MarR family transcriptional regulator [Clostridium botulinum]NFN09352.1 MarR family transcriptional regulator [Clostridium botulinum]NFN26039.1 MarR family transcriptional regulator [Clostridium botulinum]
METEDLLKCSKIISLFCRLNVNRKIGIPISSVEMEMLTLIYNAENEVTPLMISKIMNLKKPSVSGVVESLLKKNYVQKEQNCNDKRSYYLVITEKGKELLKSANDLYLSAIYTLKKELGRDAFVSFIETMNKANDILKEFRK